MEILVRNKYSATLEELIYGVDISRNSIFGNPFVMQDRSDEERERVCKEYKLYLYNSLKDSTSKLSQAMELLYRKAKEDGKLILICFCHPKSCHGDIISSWLKWRNEQK